ncbi:MAG: NfeD family protein [Gemmataceae bacterium]
MENSTLGYILIVLGFLLFAAELMIPSHGVLIAAAIFIDIVGIGMVFYYGGRYQGFVTLAAVALAAPLFAGVMYWVWPKTPMGRRLMLRGSPDAAATVADLPAVAELEVLKGRIGKATSVLRPAGVVDFDGRRVDCLSEGVLIEPNTWVRCIAVKGNRVIVRPIDEPKLKDLETADFT